MPIQREASCFALRGGDVKGFALSREVKHVLLQSIIVCICTRNTCIISKNVCAHASEIFVSNIYD